MENKKLLKYLLKDLSELDELFTEDDKNSFDEMEMEFIKNRISGAKKLVKLFLEKDQKTAEIKENSSVQQVAVPKTADLNRDNVENKSEEKNQVPKPEVKEEVVAEKVKEVVVQESSAEIEIPEEIPVAIVEEQKQAVVNVVEVPVKVEKEEIETQKESKNKTREQAVEIEQKANNKEVQLEEEEKVDVQNKRLGDSFLKEKSVNDIMSDDLSKLEHKLSNRPVASIKSSIGINDKFQYIRELFEGSADNFVTTVADLDAMEDLKEAVDYLQANFKWKKNDTSLKFVNLIKRRFSNE